jgi:ribA/ribD-fused uncharacterized protein
VNPGKAVGKECLSQWWPAKFVVDDVTYSSAEHFMMAGKARLFGDEAVLSRIFQAPTPGEAKKLGRQVRGFEQARWNAVAFNVVVRGNTEKFKQNPELLEFLLGTNTMVLVEASTVDRVWGIGLAASDPLARDPQAWLGGNLLGFALMAARQVLRGLAR